jgi:hypothetical protein
MYFPSGLVVHGLQVVSLSSSQEPALAYFPLSHSEHAVHLAFSEEEHFADMNLPAPQLAVQSARTASVVLVHATFTYLPSGAVVHFWHTALSVAVQTDFANSSLPQEVHALQVVSWVVEHAFEAYLPCPHVWQSAHVVSLSAEQAFV